jgi:hypothetical protein
MLGVSRVRHLFAGPVIVAVLAVAVALPLLLVNEGDGSYSCRGSAIVDLVHPEAVGSAGFRANFFDSGWQCNRQARQQSAVAGAVLIVGFGLSGAWGWRRRAKSHGGA